MSPLVHMHHLDHTLDEHLIPLIICLFCMPVVARLLFLVRRSEGLARNAHLWLTILLLGTAVWAAQITYVENLMREVQHEFDLFRVVSSFILAISGSAIAAWIIHAHRSRRIQLACGATFGLTVSATLIYSLSTVSMPYTLVIGRDGAVIACASGIVLGGLTAWLFNAKMLRQGWQIATLMLGVIVVLPQHLIANHIEVGGPMASSFPILPVSSEVLTILTFATLAVCLLWSVAAFITEAHEQRVRNSLMRDAILLDPLTDLPNRLRLEQHFASLRGQGQGHYLHPAAVLLFNIDSFKSINEAHGTRFGDVVLKEMAYRLSLGSGPSVFVARLGSDEFVVVLNNAADPEKVKEFAQETHARLIQPISQLRTLVRPSISVGYALLPVDGQRFDELLVKAEVALSHAKDDRNERVQRYDPEMNQQEREQSAMLQELRGAADRGELSLRYQMQHDIDTEELVGFEALLRWSHPTLGDVSPVTFIPMAERSGLIRPIGMWVLERACEESALWSKPYSVAVNVAPQQLLEKGFADAVGEVLARTGLDARRLELEITEASIIEDEENTLDVMHDLRSMGIRIAMDDFGTGYSSLAMLQKFPFDKIKIDRSFVIDVHENPERAAIIQATVLIGDAMSIPILVEGVESRDELSFLRRAKCNIIQGFIFGQPLVTEEVRDLTIIPEEFRRIWY